MVMVPAFRTDDNALRVQRWCTEVSLPDDSTGAFHGLAAVLGRISDAPFRAQACGIQTNTPPLQFPIRRVSLAPGERRSARVRNRGGLPILYAAAALLKAINS